MDVQREIEVEASPEEVWEALATEEGRERWLEPDADRLLEVVDADAPSRIVWRWSTGDGPATRVEVRVVAIPAGARVTVVEDAPRLPVSRLAAALVPALA